MKALSSNFQLIFGIIFCLLGTNAQAQVSSCWVPFDETKSAPAIDLYENGSPLDPGILLDRIKNGFDSSQLEPQLSDLYVGQEQPLIQYADMPYPTEDESVNFVNEIGTASGLVFNRVTSPINPSLAYQLNFSIDIHPALARNALLRKLGYAIPSPKYYSKITVKFPNLETRKKLMDHLASAVGDEASIRLVKGGRTELDKNNLVLTFQDVVLEPAVIEVPQMHWGIFRQDNTINTLQSRRSIRALLLPLTLLNIPQSANIYSFEAAKIYDDGINFSRTNANLFKNETSIGDIRWIANKIAKLTREDWTKIIHAAHYPADIEALLIEKTIGRTDQLLGIVGVKNFKPLAYQEHLSYGNIINGKATQEYYDGYVSRFTYGDPENPLRASELARFFGIEAITGGISDLLALANQRLSVIAPGKYIDQHNQNAFDQFLQHLQTNPSEPYIQPLEIWGGPVANGGLNTSRSIVTGTYYGSDSQVQLVDSISASASIGGFFGVSGIPKVGASITPQVQYNRSYVHVKPISDIKTAWKDRWSHLYVPGAMSRLASTLSGKEGEDADKSIESFFSEMKDGEMFIVTDGLAGGLNLNAQIPLGAVLGFIAPYSNISAGVGVGEQYAILSRTTIMKTKDGFQVYLSRIRSGAFETQMNASFFVKVLSLANTISRGTAHTRAFVLPETFTDTTQAQNFQAAIKSILKRNSAYLLETNFNPFEISHDNNGNKSKFAFGPWSWTKRENFHALSITPPIDPAGRYDAQDFVRTAIQGEITKISGSNYYGFFSSILKNFVTWFNLGGETQGDDPSAGFFGKSKSFTVSSEIETTPTKPNHTLIKLQQTHAGWSISKNNFLKIVRKIKDQVGNYNPQGGLIDESEFAQTKKIQAYTILWNLLVYENGIHRLTKILDARETSTQDAQKFLIELIGQDQYLDYCKNRQLEPSLSTGPLTSDSLEEGMLMESSRGQTTTLGCVTPQMTTVYELRQKLSQHPIVFQEEVHNTDDAKEKVRWLNRSLNDLTGDFELEKMITWMGKENAFFQVRVSGFRTKDERALDENFNANYFSNSIGTINQETFTGPFSDIADTSKISSNEIEARYLSSGY